MRASSRVCPLAIALGILLLVLAGRACADQAGTPPDRRVVIAILGFVSWEDIARVRPPALERLQREGAVGLLTRFSGAPPGVVGAYLTLGSGAQVPKSGARMFAFRDTPPGPEVPPDFRDLVLGQQFEDLPLAERATEHLHYPVPLGLLGQSLADAGLRVGAVGNADLDLSGARGSRRREAALVVMDSAGWVPYAAMGSALTTLRQGQVATNQRALVRAFAGLYPDSALLVVELGETSRAHHRAAPRSERIAALRSADAHLGAILHHIDPRDTLLLVLSPWEDYRGDQPMAPIIAWGAGVPRGWVTSASTHRLGLALSRDVAPSALRFIGLEIPETLLGTPISFRAGSPRNPAEMLAVAAHQAALVRRGRTPAGIVLSFVYGLGVVLGTFLLFAGRRDKTKRWPRPLLGFLILPTTFALWLTVSPLLLPPLTATKWRVALPLALAVATSAPAVLSWVSFRWLLLGCTAASALAIALDQIGPGFLALNSLLGYSPISDGRFYGMGNGLMAIFVASTLIVLPLVWERAGSRRIVDWALFAFAALGVAFVGMPFLGANFGGLVTYGAGAWAIWVLLRRGKIRCREFVLVVMLTLLGVAACLTVDALSPPAQQTHLGRTVSLVGGGGLGELWQILMRKAEVNLHILLFVRWGAIFALLLPVVVYAVLKPVAVLAQMMQDRPALAASIKASVYAGIVGMLTNDSGIAVPCLIIGQVLPAAIALASESRQRPPDLAPPSPESPRS